jgi:predicted HicB family RNase H-like nuclease
MREGDIMLKEKKPTKYIAFSVDKDLHTAVKVKASTEGKSIKHIIVHLLQKYISA